MVAEEQEEAGPAERRAFCSCAIDFAGVPFVVVVEEEVEAQ